MMNSCQFLPIEWRAQFRRTRSVLPISLVIAMIAGIAGCKVRNETEDLLHQRIERTKTPITPGLDLCANQLAMLSDGSFYVGSRGVPGLKKISATGVVTSIAADPYALAKDRRDNVYVAVRGAVLMIAPDGTLRTLVDQAVDESKGEDSQDGIVRGVRFSQIRSIAVDQALNVYLREGGIPNVTIRKVSPNGIASTIFSGEVGWHNNNWEKTAFAVDSKENLYFGIRGAIVRVNPSGEISTFVGAESYELGPPKDGQGGNAAFASEITDITVDADDNLYVVTTARWFIRKVSPAGVVTTLAGKFTPVRQDTDPIQPGDLVDGSERGNLFYPRSNLQLDSKGNVFFLECNVNALRKLSPDGQITTVMRGELNPSSW